MPRLRIPLFALALTMIALVVATMVNNPDTLGDFQGHPWLLVDMLVALIALLILVVQDHRRLHAERGPEPVSLPSSEHTVHQSVTVPDEPVNRLPPPGASG